VWDGGEPAASVADAARWAAAAAATTLAAAARFLPDLAAVAGGQGAAGEVDGDGEGAGGAAGGDVPTRRRVGVVRGDQGLYGGGPAVDPDGAARVARAVEALVVGRAAAAQRWRGRIEGGRHVLTAAALGAAWAGSGGDVGASWAAAVSLDGLYSVHQRGQAAAARRRADARPEAVELARLLARRAAEAAEAD